MWLGHRERRRLRAQQGLDGTGDQVVVARCALRPGVAEDAVCEKADDGCAIKGSEKYLKMVCTEVSRPVPPHGMLRDDVICPSLGVHHVPSSEASLDDGRTAPSTITMLAGGPLSACIRCNIQTSTGR